MTLTITTTSPDGTRDLGRGLAPALRAGDVIALHGDLGAGKTVLVQGLADGLQAIGRVTSPTFVIMRRHPSASPEPAPVLVHVDAYRLTGGNDLLDMGLDDWLADGAVAIEWADNVAAALPPDHLAIDFAADGDCRTLTVTAHGPRARELLAHLRRCGY